MKHSPSHSYRNTIKKTPSLKKFKAGQCHFILKAKDRLILSPYKSGILIDELRKIFMKLYCIFKKETDCIRTCVFMDKCPYSILFETYSPPGESKYTDWLEEVPLPFVIEPLWEDKASYQVDEPFEFRLILIGKALEYLPYFILAFKELGHLGIGSEKKHFELLKVFDSDREVIYDQETGIIKSSKAVKQCENPEEYYDRNILALRFQTPTRIHYQDKLVIQPEFHVLIRELLRRIEVLSYLYWHKKLQWNKSYYVSEAEKISIKMSNLEWTDWEPIASGEESEFKLGGFTGDIVYSGNILPFLPILLIGQEVHIGELCTLGLGKYEMKTLL
ncbi:MAG: CRISPR system precrRNA processing endoribonuclease RAMP protein Cas6 [Candidatus Aureabacteria bacterium]|nr:CRISPR system precrRNA processing endoribonuclease RAMP protein Cas6 [Candidatus Auribacterota bacterium]